MPKPEPDEQPDAQIEECDVAVYRRDDGLQFNDLGSAMSVLVPHGKTGDAVTFILEHADEVESEVKEEPEVVAREYLTDEVSIVYWDDGMFGLTDDAAEATITIPQEGAGSAEAALTDLSE